MYHLNKCHTDTVISHVDNAIAQELEFWENLGLDESDVLNYLLA